MNVEQARTLACALLAEFGLHDWTFRFDRAYRRFGRCRQSDKLITMSRALTEANDESEVRDTILHEIAHALVGAGHGHDATWRTKAREIGARPTRCYGSEVAKAAPRWFLVCERCGYRATRYRNTGYAYTHRRCGGLMHWQRA